MPISLYDAAIPTILQTLGAGHTWIDKAEASDLTEEQIASARLIEDMLPFAYQLKSMAFHSMGAIEGLRAGVIAPDKSEPPTTFATMRAKLAEAEAFLTALDPAELEGFIGRDMRFEVGDFKIPFTGEHFLTSFAVPNFFFHATTAYAILRAKGVAVGKRDYLGTMRTRQEG